MKTAADHLQDLIRIPSVSSLSNRPIIAHAIETLHAAQWQTRQHPYIDAAGVEKVNLIAAPQGQPIENPAADLAFVCHTDTVPWSPGWAAATEPFVRDGMLHGCGACDVKGFFACLLTAIVQSASSKFIDGLRLVLTADEEIGCIGASRLIASNAIRPRRAVIGEPTSLRPARAGKGYCLAEIAIYGQEAHSALPHQGKSAIYRAARLITAIEEFALRLAEQQHSFFSPAFTTLNVGTIQGGSAKNIIPGECRFHLEWRPIPGQSPDTVPAAVANIVRQLQETDPGLRCNLDIKRQQNGFETSPDSQLVHSIEAFTGRKSTSIPFGSEATLFARVAEEAVVFGPGDMQTAHSDRECVPLNELEEAVAILKSLMLRT